MELSIYLPETEAEIEHLRIALSGSNKLETDDIDGFMNVMVELRTNHKLRYKVEAYHERFGGKLYSILVKCLVNKRMEELEGDETIKGTPCLSTLVAYLHKIGVSQSGINANLKIYSNMHTKALVTLKRNRKNFFLNPTVSVLTDGLKANSKEALEYLYLSKMLANNQTSLETLKTFFIILSKPKKDESK
jgi:hypothetical protein